MGLVIRGALHSLAVAGLLAPGLAVAAQEEDPITLPSGLEAQFHEMIWDEPGQGLVYRFRFVAQAFSQDAPFESLMADLEFLCNSYAIPRLATIGPVPNQVIISLADKRSEFGQYNPDVAQVFEAYRIENDTCIWEVF